MVYLSLNLLTNFEINCMICACCYAIKHLQLFDVYIDLHASAEQWFAKCDVLLSYWNISMSTCWYLSVVVHPSSIGVVFSHLDQCTSFAYTCGAT